MPSLVMLPFIQCHQTRGLALSGGLAKPRSRASPELWPETTHAPASATAAAVQTRHFDPISAFMVALLRSTF